MAQERPIEVNATLAGWLAVKVPDAWPIPDTFLDERSSKRDEGWVQSGGAFDDTGEGCGRRTCGIRTGSRALDCWAAQRL
jgi:hypothetical protein